MSEHSREETRIERYQNKLERAVKLPVSLVTVNFHCDDNLAYLIRTAACFGISDIHVIGTIPPRKVLLNPSGSTVDFVKLHRYRNPSEFLNFVRKNDVQLVSAEIADQARSLYDYQFNFEKHTAIVLGNESIGIPSEILMNSQILYIPMIGAGFCMNTSQTGTAFVSECCRQYLLTY